MSRKVTFTLAVMIVILLFGGIAGSARAADVVDVSVQNKNSYTITLTFVGLKIYQFDLAPGKTTIQIERGDYTHSYYGCGKLNFTDVTIKPKDNEIVIEDCNKSGGSSGVPAADEGEITITSRSNKHVQVVLLGQYTYVLEVPSGKSTHIVKKGAYQISYYDCGLLNVDTIQIKKETEFTIKNCSEPDLPETEANTRVLEVRNKTSTSFPITLIGLESNKDYFFTLVPGNNKLHVAKGNYSYSYYACSALHYGTVNVPIRGAEMQINTCSSSANGSATTENLTTFKVKNNTGDLVLVQLNGIVDYLFTVTGSGSFLTVEKGYYQYTLWACGTTYNGVIQVTPNNVILRTPFCKNSQ